MAVWYHPIQSYRIKDHAILKISKFMNKLFIVKMESNIYNSWKL